MFDLAVSHFDGKISFLTLGCTELKNELKQINTLVASSELIITKYMTNMFKSYNFMACLMFRLV